MSLDSTQSNPDSSQDTMDISASADPDASESQTEPSELDKYWKAVKENPSDFTGWTYLLQYVEQENKIESARPAFDAFLAKYPYCYGYWKKYADMEKKNECLDEAEQVLERGVMAIPLSIDLWMHLINFSQEKYKNDIDKEDKIRKIFERALTAAGTDFRSDKLWELQIAWEEENKNLPNVMKLYDRLVAIPTQLYSHNFDNLCSFVRKHHPREILSLDEFLKLRQDIVKQMKADASNATEALVDSGVQPSDVADSPSDDEAPTGDILPPGEEDNAPPGEGIPQDKSKSSVESILPETHPGEATLPEITTFSEDIVPDKETTPVGDAALTDGTLPMTEIIETDPTKILTPENQAVEISSVKDGIDENIAGPKNGLKMETDNTSEDMAIDGTQQEEDVPLMEVLRPTELPPTKEVVPPGTEQTLEDEAEIAAIREKVIEIRKSVHSVTEQEVSRRWSFEEGVRRPYFHVKPLEKVQLKNWRDYLDMEMESGSNERAVVLFERCLIACALYEEFWMKYANYLEKHSVDAVRNVYKRACSVFLKKKPVIHLAWAAFEEKQGYFDEAEEVLENLEKDLPKLAMVRLRRISVARRRGHFDKVGKLYSAFISEADSDKEKSFYAIKLARYQSKVLCNLEGARQTLQTALDADKTNAKLYLQLLDLEYQQKEIDESRVNAVFNEALESAMELEHRVAFSQRRLEFLEDFSRSVSRIQESYEAHQKLVKELNAQAGKKRKSQETSKETSQVEKKPKLEGKSQSNGSTASDYYSSSQSSYSQQSYSQHSQNSYDGYNMHPPPPAQGYYGQAWNSGYNSVPYSYHHNQWAPYGNQYYGS